MPRSVQRNPHLAFPTTGVLAGEDLLVVNAQFDDRERMRPTLPFYVARFDLTRFD